MMADEEEVWDPTPGDINSRLLERLAGSDTVAAKRLEPLACIAVGFPKGKTATFDGTGGDNFGGLNHGAQLILNGGTGRFAGNSMHSGEIIINGSAGSGAGHGLAGGTLVVQGSVRGGAAAGMLDGELLVAGDVEGALGAGMQGGTVVVAGDVGGDVARYMAGGKLFIAGNFTPPAAGAKPAAPAERKAVQRLLQEHGIDPHGLEFQRVSGGAVAAPPKAEAEELPELLSRLRLVPAVLKRRPRRPGLDHVSPGLVLGPGTGEPLNLTIPLLWQGDHAPQVASWAVGAKAPSFDQCNLAVIDLCAGTLPRRLDMERPDDLARVVELVRQSARDRVPVLVRLPAGDLSGDMGALRTAASDGVILAPGSVPLEAALSATRGSGLPVLAEIPRASADDVLKLLALGAAGVVLTGEVTLNRLSKLGDQLAHAMGALGAGSASELGPEQLRALDQEVAALTGVPLAGYDAPLPMWRH
ncbi:MAG: hypothetical protein MK222_04110 [Candidatus Poseidoniia archaeon]|nr:hypothetical protein [Candidatus Poseidoniia archaeon]